MCEFNRPHFISDSHCLNNRIPSEYTQAEPTVLPPEAWTARTAELEEDHLRVINKAVEDAAALAADVHLYRSIASPFLGIALEPGVGPTVKIWEHN